MIDSETQPGSENQAEADTDDVVSIDDLGDFGQGPMTDEEKLEAAAPPENAKEVPSFYATARMGQKPPEVQIGDYHVIAASAGDMVISVNTVNVRTKADLLTMLDTMKWALAGRDYPFE